MTKHATRKAARYRRAGAVALICASFHSHPVLAEARVGGDVAASARASSNPFSLSSRSEGTSATSVNVAVSPWLKIDGENTSLELQGSVRLDQYTKSYGRDVSGSVRLSAKHDLSEYVLLRGGGSFGSSRTAAHELLFRRLPADSLPVPGEPLPDVGLDGRAGRTNSLTGYVGGEARLDAYDTLSLDASVHDSENPRLSDADHRTLRGSSMYERRFSDRLSANVELSYSKTNYRNRRQGDGSFFSPKLGIEYVFGEGLSMSASVGVSFVRSARADFTKRKYERITASVRVCRASERTRLCANADRATQPTSLGGITSVTNVGLAYDRVLGERNKLSVSAYYADSGNSSEPLFRQTRFVGASATYDHRLQRRLSIYVSPSVAKLFERGNPRKIDYSIAAGVRITIGAER